MFIEEHGCKDYQVDHLRRKFSEIKKERLTYLRRDDLPTWNQLFFCTSSDPSHSDLSQYSNEDSPLEQFPTLTFEIQENFSQIRGKHISQLQNKAIRNRLSKLRSHVEVVAQHEDCTPKTIVMYLVKLYSLEEHDKGTVNVITDNQYRKVRAIR